MTFRRTILSGSLFECFFQLSSTLLKDEFQEHVIALNNEVRAFTLYSFLCASNNCVTRLSANSKHFCAFYPTAPYFNYFFPT